MEATTPPTIRLNFDSVHAKALAGALLDLAEESGFMSPDGTQAESLENLAEAISQLGTGSAAAVLLELGQ